METTVHVHVFCGNSPEHLQRLINDWIDTMGNREHGWRLSSVQLSTCKEPGYTAEHSALIVYRLEAA